MLFRLAQAKNEGNLMLFKRIDCNRLRLNLKRFLVLPFSLSLLESLLESELEALVGAGADAEAPETDESD